MFNFFKKNDADIQRDVMKELKWDPSINSDSISATIKDGIVTLSGSVPHYFEKCYAEKATQRVGGVRAVADELEVNLQESQLRSDEDIARVAMDALNWDYQVPDGVKVSVEKGWITLRGEVDWDYQRSAAKYAVGSLFGVTNVSNNITLKSKSINAFDIKNDIEDALKRSSKSEGREIRVEVDGHEVTLSGLVDSLSEMEEARMAAWKAPGVSMVKDHMKLAV